MNFVVYADSESNKAVKHLYLLHCDTDAFITIDNAISIMAFILRQI